MGGITGREDGAFVTNNEEYYERACLLGHCERVPFTKRYKDLEDFALGYKFRINRLTAQWPRYKSAS